MKHTIDIFVVLQVYYCGGIPIAIEAHDNFADAQERKAQLSEDKKDDDLHYFQVVKTQLKIG